MTTTVDFPPEYTPFPAERAAAYREAGLWIGQRLDALPQGEPDHAALIDEEESVTYAQLADEVAACAEILRRRGVRERDLVALHLPNTVSVIIFSLAIMRAGAIPVYLLDSHQREDVRAIMSSCRARGYVSTAQRLAETDLEWEVALDAAEVREQARQLREAADWREQCHPGTTDPADVAFLQLSGGTTGVPKLIPKTHDDYAYSIRRSVELCGFDPTTVLLIVLPATHNYPTSSPGYLGTLSAGGTVVLSPHGAPEHAFELIERHGVTHIPLVPPLARVWSDAAPGTSADLSSVQVIQVGGGKLTPEAARQLDNAGDWRVQQVFGMAEGMVCYSTDDDPQELVYTTQGRPMSPYDEVRIVDEHGDPVPDGTPGLLQVRGAYTICGYWDAPAANARSFTADGFYESGDIVRRLDSGHLVVEGRAKDHINRGGEKVSAEEVEDHLLTHPAVFDAAVVGIPDEHLGERVHAVLVLREGHTLRRPDMSAYLKKRGVARFKIPDSMSIVDAFPVTKVGKLSRAELRVQLREDLLARRS